MPDPSELAERGERFFREYVAEHVRERAPYDFVFIAPEAGDWEVAASEMEAWRRLRARHPQAYTYSRRVGFPYGGQIGGGMSAQRL